MNQLLDDSPEDESILCNFLLFLYELFFRGPFLWSMIDDDVKALKQGKFKKCIHLQKT